MASKETAKNGSYPIVRPLFFYYPTSKEAYVKPFVTYVLSADGQKTVDEIGYITLSK